MLSVLQNIDKITAHSTFRFKCQLSVLHDHLCKMLIAAPPGIGFFAYLKTPRCLADILIGLVNRRRHFPLKSTEIALQSEGLLISVARSITINLI